MKYKKTKRNLKIFVIILALLVPLQSNTVVRANTVAENNTESTRLIITQDKERQEVETTVAKIELGNTLYSCNISPVLLKDCWMIPIKGVLSDIMGIYCNIDEESGNITIKDPTGAKDIQVMLDSSQATVDGKEVTLSFPIVKVENSDLSKMDYLIPYEFIMDQLGFSHFVQEEKNEDQILQYYVLQIASDYLYYQTAGNVTYDTQKYQDSLRAVVASQNSTGSKNYVQGYSEKPMTEHNVSVTQSAKNYYVTLKFPKTYNPFGTVTKNINNGIIESLKIWETSSYTTCIRVTYYKKYVFSSSPSESKGKLTFSKGNFSMKAALPESVSYKKITTTDQYWKEQFIIQIPGNHVSFYKTYQPYDNSSDIREIKVSKTSSGNTRLTVKTKGLKGYKLIQGNGCFTVKVGEPKDIYKNIVLLDAGHGGKDSGALGGGLKEKNINLSIIYTRIEKYFEDKDSTVKAYWTRHDDTFINLYKRPTYSKKYQADLFVSLHMNSASSAANGTEVYYSSANNKKDFSGITSKLFAKKMQSTLVNTLGTKNRGVKQAGYVVTKYNTVPSILIELGFITGSSDRKKLRQASFQKKAAKSIYNGICATFKQYPTKR